MRSNGSLYVAVVLAVLAGYFTYQWWFNPRRVITRRLGELAATLSVPVDNPGDVDRLARIARLRNYFAPDVHVTLGGSAPAIASSTAWYVTCPRVGSRVPGPIEPSTKRVRPSPWNWSAASRASSAARLLMA